MFLPSKVPSLWRIDIVVCRESNHTVVKRFVFESKPEIPVPVLFEPSALKKVKSDSRNLPSWIMNCLQVPLVTRGFPFAGKNVFCTSQFPTNCASSFWPAPVRSAARIPYETVAQPRESSRKLPGALLKSIFSLQLNYRRTPTFVAHCDLIEDSLLCPDNGSTRPPSAYTLQGPDRVGR